jgi:hypothetical protein
MTLLTHLKHMRQDNCDAWGIESSKKEIFLKYATPLNVTILSIAYTMGRR